MAKIEITCYAVFSAAGELHKKAESRKTLSLERYRRRMFQDWS